MQQVPVRHLNMVEKVLTLLAKPPHVGAQVTSLVPVAEVKSLDAHVDKRALCAVGSAQKYLDVVVDGYRLWAMNDPGSAFSIVSSTLAKELGWRIEWPKDRFRVIDGKTYEFEGRLGEVELQLHDALSVFVTGIRVVSSSKHLMLLGTDVITSDPGRVLRKRGERVETNGETHLQVEVEGPAVGVWYNLPLRAANQLTTEAPAAAATFELLVGAVEQTGDALEAFAAEDQGDLTLRWL